MLVKTDRVSESNTLQFTPLLAENILSSVAPHAQTHRQGQVTFQAPPVRGAGKAGEKMKISSAGANNGSSWGMRERLIKENREVTILYNLAQVLNSNLRLTEVIQNLYKESGRLLDTANFAIVLYDHNHDLANFILVFDQGRKIKPFSVPLSHNLSLIGRVLIHQTPLLAQNLVETNFTDEITPFHSAQPIRSWMGAPLLRPEPTADPVQGAIITWSYEPNTFTDDQLWLLSAISAQAGIAIHNARLFEANQRRVQELRVENACLRESLLTERERVIKAEKQTRSKLARDLHDGATQLISSIKMRLDFCKLILTKEPAKLAQEIDKTQKLADEAVHEIRNLLFELRPLVLEKQGLSDALRAFLERRQENVETTRLSLKIEVSEPDKDIARQDEEVETTIFAVAQEAVNNALKHAQAKNIRVHLRETPTAIKVTINDDGQGFDLAEILNDYEQRGSLGMVNLRERAELIGGELTMSSTPGQGTHISVDVPKAREERLKKYATTRRLSLPSNHSLS
jgi:signal transduction histidine kinase